MILQLKTILSRTEMSVANLNVNGNLTFNSNIEMKNVDAIGGGKITGDIDIDNDLYVSGISIFRNSVSLSEINLNSICKGDIVFKDIITVNTLIVSNTSHIVLTVNDMNITQTMVNINSLNVGNDTIMVDATINNYLYVDNDAHIDNNLYIEGNVTIKTCLQLTGDLYVNDVLRIKHIYLLTDNCDNEYEATQTINMYSHGIDIGTSNSIGLRY